MSHEPTLKEELDRKTSEALHDILARVESGRLSSELAVERARAVWAVVSGLADQELTDLAERLVTELATRKDSKSIYMRNEVGTVMRIKYPLDAPDFEVATFEVGKEPVLRRFPGEVGADRAGRIKNTIQYLSRQGYKPI